MTRVSGKVALITGAARGQGRSHALALAGEGADVILVDVAGTSPHLNYQLGTGEELEATAADVRSLGRRAIAVVADVRQPDAMVAAVDAGVDELGRLDVVVANAGVVAFGTDVPLSAYNHTIEVNFNGVVHTVTAALPHLGEWSSIVVTGSVALFSADFLDNPGVGYGTPAYRLSKNFVGMYVHDLARLLSHSRIRVNAIHPTTVDTPMIDHPAAYRAVRPDLEDPRREDMLDVLGKYTTAMDIPYIETSDVSHAVVYLASDESRYVTGTQLRIDAGTYLTGHLEPW